MGFLSSSSYIFQRLKDSRIDRKGMLGIIWRDWRLMSLSFPLTPSRGGMKMRNEVTWNRQEAVGSFLSFPHLSVSGLWIKHEMKGKECGPEVA